MRESVRRWAAFTLSGIGQIVGTVGEVAEGSLEVAAREIHPSKRRTRKAAAPDLPHLEEPWWVRIGLVRPNTPPPPPTMRPPQPPKPKAPPNDDDDDDDEQRA